MVPVLPVPEPWERQGEDELVPHTIKGYPDKRAVFICSFGVTENLLGAGGPRGGDSWSPSAVNLSR